MQPDSFFQPLAASGCDTEIPEYAVADTVDPAMDFYLLAPFPRLLQNRGVAEVVDLGRDIDFTQLVAPFFARKGAKFRTVFQV